MATDPLKPNLNRAQQVKVDSQFQKGIKLYDIDLAIAEHMQDTVIPTIDEMGEKIKVPLIYGNPERWKAIRQDGYLRDSKGQIQTPLVMFKRNSFAPNDAMPNMMNRHLSYPSQTKYSPKHRYDKFSLMTGVTKPVESYNITIPDYVTLTYEVMVWTNFIEHMNIILEAFQYASDEYWGDKHGYKFRTIIDSFDTPLEIGEGTERIVRSTFTMAVHAYLLPEKFDNRPTTEKAFSPKKVVWTIFDDLTAEDGTIVEQGTPSENVSYAITSFNLST